MGNDVGMASRSELSGSELSGSELSGSELLASELSGSELLVSELLESKGEMSEIDSSRPQLSEVQLSEVQLSEPLLPNRMDLWQDTLQWQPNSCQQSQFQQLYEQILQGNRQFNLTRITEPSEFWEKHLWDSLRGVGDRLQAAATVPFSVLDIGTGAGFPGIPLAIAQPAWRLTLLDSTRKKINFLDQVLDALGVENARTLCDRAEALGHQPRHRASYNLVLIRAVSAASVCAEYALPLVKLGGLAILYRGQWQPEETDKLVPILAQLGGTLETVDTFVTPLSGSDRTCLQIRKTAATPLDFPRAIGLPAQKPLE